MLSLEKENPRTDCNRCNGVESKCDCGQVPGQLPSLGPVMHSLNQGESLLIKKIKGLEELLKGEARSVMEIQNESGETLNNGQGHLYQSSMKEAFTMPGGPSVGMRTEFEKILSMYDQSYQCLIEDLVKRQSGNGDVASETVYAEWDRLSKLEGKLVDMVGAMSSAKNGVKQINQSLKNELTAKRQHLAQMSETLIPSAQPSSIMSTSTVGARKPSFQSGAAHHSMTYPNPYATVSLGAKAESTGLYARMFYTRLIFWVILAVMLAIATIHAYSSSGNSIVLNTLSVIVALIILYYGIRFIYNRWFY
jgi:hypothetical protein